MTGESLKSLIADRILTPLGLTGTALPAPADVTLPAPATGNYLGKAGASELAEDGAKKLKAGIDVTKWSLSSAQVDGRCTRRCTTSRSGRRRD